MLVMFAAGFIVQIYLKSFGVAAVAAYGVALRVEQLFLLPVFGLTGALLPIAARILGLASPTGCGRPCLPAGNLGGYLCYWPVEFCLSRPTTL